MVVVVVCYGCGGGVLWLWWWCVMVVVVVCYGCGGGVLWLWWWCVMVVVVVCYGCGGGVLWLWWWCVMVVVVVVCYGVVVVCYGCGGGVLWLWWWCVMVVVVEENVTKGYNKSTRNEVEKVNVEANKIVGKIGLEDRVQCIAENSAFITIKDHKPNFSNNIACRLLNPCKSDVGKVNKVHLERINEKIRT